MYVESYSNAVGYQYYFHPCQQISVHGLNLDTEMQCKAMFKTRKILLELLHYRLVDEETKTCFLSLSLSLILIFVPSKNQTIDVSIFLVNAKRNDNITIKTVDFLSTCSPNTIIESARAPVGAIVSKVPG